MLVGAHVIPSVARDLGARAARSMSFCAPPAPPVPSLTLGMTRGRSR